METTTKARLPKGIRKARRRLLAAIKAAPDQGRRRELEGKLAQLLAPYEK